MGLMPFTQKLLASEYWREKGPQAEAYPAPEARRKENGEAVREIARSYNVHNSTISRLTGAKGWM
jgi:hypothetical protein